MKDMKKFFIYSCNIHFRQVRSTHELGDSFDINLKIRVPKQFHEYLDEIWSVKEQHCICNYFTLLLKNKRFNVQRIYFSKDDSNIFIHVDLEL